MATLKLNFTSLYDFQKAFPTEASCIRFLEKKRWPNGVVSPYAPTSKVYIYKQKGRYTCKNTGKDFNVRTGTIFGDTKIPLRKWFLAIFLVVTCPKGISATKIKRDIGVSYKTAWFLLHRIRETFTDNGEPFTSEVEIDEIFVGGKNGRRHWDRKCPLSKGRSHQDKKPVLGMLQRDTGNGKRVICEVVPDTRQQNLTMPILEHVDLTAVLMVDDWNGYGFVDKIYETYSVDHGRKQYADGDIYTNTIEGFWGNYCKRAFYGCYNWIKGSHMHRYFNEFAFRYNYSQMSEKDRFSKFFDNIEHRLTYKQLVNENKDRNLQPLAKTSAEQRKKKKQMQDAANATTTSTAQGVTFTYTTAGQ